MSKGIVCCRPSAWWPVALSLLLVAFSSLVAGAAGPFPFEDVNNNGVWDAGVDRDITDALQPNEWVVYYATPHSIVIPAGVTFLKSFEKFTGFYLVAGTNITVNSSMNAAVYAGMVDLQALGGDVVIGPGVILTGRDYVSVYASRDVVVGAGASFKSSGGSANLGTVNVRANTGDIALGDKVKVTTLRDVFITALAGDVTVAPGLQLNASQGAFDVDGRRVMLNGARLRAADMSISGGGVPLEFKNNRVTVPQSGAFHIHNPGSSVDITGTILPKIQSIVIQAAQIID
jgi:hypothetical protein